MEIVTHDNIIKEYAIKKQCVCVYIYTCGYCEPNNYSHDACFIKSDNLNEIMENVAKYLSKNTKNYEYEYDFEINEKEITFTIDTCINVVVKNMNKNTNINFNDIEKIVYDELEKNLLVNKLIKYGFAETSN